MSKKKAKSKKPELERKTCLKCNKDRVKSRDFYMSNSDNHGDGRYPVCKPCLRENFTDEEDYMSESSISKIQDILVEMNRPYIHHVWMSSVEEAMDKNKEIVGTMLKNINLNHKHKNWRDSEFADDEKVKDDAELLRYKKKYNSKAREKKKKAEELNAKNEADVLRLLQYDPFEFESEEDRPMLFNRLIDYLSEDVLEDAFRLSSAISIVRTFNQIDRIDADIANAKTHNLSNLIKTKREMSTVVQSIAKENGFSIGSKGKGKSGSSTLTGIMKQLDDYDFHEADANLFDIETAEGMSQVADLSNKNIMKQLSFDENDYTEMLKDNREMLENFESRAKKCEEDNRLLRVEISEGNEREKELKERIKELEKQLEDAEDD